MESLHQWASVSDGLAFKVEDCPNPSDLVAQIKAKLEQVRQGKHMRQPIGVNAWMLVIVAGCLGAEWLLRKKWNLV
jgi:hypothetical protein